MNPTPERSAQKPIAGFARKSTILVWDLPTRLTHWVVAVSFAGAFLTAGSERLLELHITFGYTMIAMIAFRLLWGVIGTRYARFRSFAFGPARLVSYLRSLMTRSPQRYVGHNPAGSWAIVGLFTLALSTALTGYANLNGLAGGWMHELHESAAAALLALVAVHIAGVVVSSVLHRENLAAAMVTGCKSGHVRESIRYRHRAVAVLLVMAIAALWVRVPDAPFLDGAYASLSSRSAERHDRD